MAFRAEKRSVETEVVRVGPVHQIAEKIGEAVLVIAAGFLPKGGKCRCCPWETVKTVGIGGCHAEIPFRV